MFACFFGQNDDGFGIHFEGPLCPSDKDSGPWSREPFKNLKPVFFF